MPRSVASHFEKSAPAVRSTYTAILNAARDLGPVREDPKKTSIHLVRDSAFAGVAVRKESLVLTLKSQKRIKNRRVHKTEQLSANRWYFETRLASPSDVDAEVRAWLMHSYELAS